MIFSVTISMLVLLAMDMPDTLLSLDIVSAGMAEIYYI